MAQWHDWWPVSEEEAERVLRLLRTAAARFMTELVGDVAFRVLDAGTRIDELPNERLFRFGPHVRVRTSADAMRRLARAALRAPSDAPPGDSEALLERFAERAMTELVRRMIRSAGREPGDSMLEGAEPDAATGKPLYDVAVGDSAGAPLVRVAFWRGLFRNAAARSEHRTFGPLAAREEALKDMPIDVSATVGRASLSLDEITSLAPGDVILLDGSVSVPIDVVADSRRVASGFPCRSGRQRAVQLTATSG